MSGMTWPPAVKEWVSKCLSEMTESNRAAANAELKQVLHTATSNNTLWTTDWANVKLESLKQPVKLQLKRKQNPVTPQTPTTNNIHKKAKKAPVFVQATPPPLTPYSPTPPLTPDPEDKLEMRARRFQREHEIEKRRGFAQVPYADTRHVNSSDYLAERSNALSLSHSRSQISAWTKYKYSGQDDAEPMYDPNVIDWDKYTIVGRSQSLFKNYLRLTSEPDPNEIRPLPVLQKTLSELKRRWKIENSYPWTCDQFKSMRQDLTVQRIKNSFTVQVYEIHARMALESQDLVEYNQCQATLKQLYELGLEGHREEFMAYRILYLVHLRNSADLNNLLSQLTPEQKSQEYIRHALQVQAAIATNNYHGLFTLYLNAPNMGGYIMDHMVERERVGALVIMSKAYRELPLSFIASELAVEPMSDLHKLLATIGVAHFVKSGGSNMEAILDCKNAHKIFSDWHQTKYQKINIKGQI